VAPSQTAGYRLVVSNVGEGDETASGYPNFEADPGFFPYLALNVQLLIASLNLLM
jgi:hypothetical protein